jgi:hypothetical protein
MWSAEIWMAELHRYQSAGSSSDSETLLWIGPLDAPVDKRRVRDDMSGRPAANLFPSYVENSMGYFKENDYFVDNRMDHYKLVSRKTVFLFNIEIEKYLKVLDEQHLKERAEEFFQGIEFEFEYDKQKLIPLLLLNSSNPSYREQLDCLIKHYNFYIDFQPPLAPIASPTPAVSPPANKKQRIEPGAPKKSDWDRPFDGFTIRKKRLGGYRWPFVPYDIDNLSTNVASKHYVKSYYEFEFSDDAREMSDYFQKMMERKGDDTDFKENAEKYDTAKEIKIDENLILSLKEKYGTLLVFERGKEKKLVEITWYRSDNVGGQFWREQSYIPQGRKLEDSGLEKQLMKNNNIVKMIENDEKYEEQVYVKIQDPLEDPYVRYFNPCGDVKVKVKVVPRSDGLKWESYSPSGEAFCCKLDNQRLYDALKDCTTSEKEFTKDEISRFEIDDYLTTRHYIYIESSGRYFRPVTKETKEEAQEYDFVDFMKDVDNYKLQSQKEEIYFDDIPYWEEARHMYVLFQYPSGEKAKFKLVFVEHDTRFSEWWSKHGVITGGRKNAPFVVCAGILGRLKERILYIDNMSGTLAPLKKHLDICKSVLERNTNFYVCAYSQDELVQNYESDVCKTHPDKKIIEYEYHNP